ncbi:MAG: hypothetical protein JW910_08475 [Anaerolineae bacterium]|nr:hypothetical protein [Anaerolineae bacterium]
MQLGTFAAVFEAALALEDHLAARYQAQSAAQPAAVAAAYRDLAADNTQRHKRLERVRRETVTEMILIPITDLVLGDDLAALAEADPGAPLPLAAARSVEASAQRFYEAAAAQIGQDEAARALQRMAKGNSKRLAQLETL